MFGITSYANYATIAFLKTLAFDNEYLIQNDKNIWKNAAIVGQINICMDISFKWVFRL